MIWGFLFLLASLALALSARCFISAILEGPIRMRTAEYNVAALRLARWYRIISWGIVSGTLLSSDIGLFWVAVQSVLA